MSKKAVYVQRKLETLKKGVCKQGELETTDNNEVYAQELECTCRVTGVVKTSIQMSVPTGRRGVLVKSGHMKKENWSILE